MPASVSLPATVIRRGFMLDSLICRMRAPSSSYFRMILNTYNDAALRHYSNTRRRVAAGGLPGAVATRQERRF